MPVFFFHGFGTTRVACPPDAPAIERGIRLISVDRPGIGLSDSKPGRTLHWPADVAQLADQLGLDDFAIVCWSGGGPYGLARGRPGVARQRHRCGQPGGTARRSGDPGHLRRFDRNAVRAAGRARG
jgi:hypothetical protein